MYVNSAQQKVKNNLKQTNNKIKYTISKKEKNNNNKQLETCMNSGNNCKIGFVAIRRKVKKENSREEKWNREEHKNPPICVINNNLLNVICF